MQLIDDGGLSTSNVSTDGNDKHVVYQEDCMCERMSVGRSVSRNGDFIVIIQISL